MFNKYNNWNLIINSIRHIANTDISHKLLYYYPIAIELNELQILNSTNNNCICFVFNLTIDELKKAKHTARYIVNLLLCVARIKMDLMRTMLSNGQRCFHPECR